MVAGQAAAWRPPPPKKHTGPGQPWLDQETAHLIDAYEEHWCASRRGQLRAHQWEEVAAGIAARLGLARPRKSGTQCRHKIEKLRRRYRAERRRPAPSLWPFFDRMGRMERGPFPISARPPPPSAAGGHREEEEEEEDEEAEEVDSDGDGDRSDDDAEEGADEEGSNGANTRSANGLLSEDNWLYPKISSCGEYGEKNRSEDGEVRAVEEWAATVDRFREGFARLEKRRLELMREMERDWMEMEAKRAQLVAASQRDMLDAVAGAFGSTKKPRNMPEV